MSKIPVNSVSMEHGALFQLIDCSIKTPQPGSPTVAFVPLLGFTSAIYHGKVGWQSTITHQKIEPTYWIQPYEVPEHMKTLLEISERLEGDPETVSKGLLFFEKLLKSFSHE